jgi:nucleotide-binding universal stress UspA family protein
MNDLAEFVIRRILVALDASAHSRAALEEATALAAAMEAELLGLFVEDIDLVRIAGLPFARQVTYPSGAEERLSSERIERELKAQAELARKALAAAAAGRKHTRWSFRTVRGKVASEILAAASQADLVLLGKSGGSPARPVGSTALALIATSPGAFLLVPQGTPQTGSIAVLFEGSSDSRRALDAAIRLAVAHQTGLLVLVPGHTPESCDALRESARQTVGSRVKEFRIRRVQPAPGDLANALRAERSRLLVLPGGSALAQEAGIRLLLEITSSPLLLIR